MPGNTTLNGNIPFEQMPKSRSKPFPNLDNTLYETYSTEIKNVNTSSYTDLKYSMKKKRNIKIIVMLLRNLERTLP